MRFKLVKTGKSHSEPSSESLTVSSGETTQDQEEKIGGPIEGTVPAKRRTAIPSVIWEGTVDEYRSLLVLREAELVAAKAQLRGNDYVDWWTENRILDLEVKVADLRKWLTEATKNANES